MRCWIESELIDLFIICHVYNQSQGYSGLCPLRYISINFLQNKLE